MNPKTFLETAHPETLAIRTGQLPTDEQSHSEPIFCTSSFIFKSAEEAAGRFSGEIPGNIYARFTNPTVRVFEERLASLEQGEACVATASGMAAILTTALAFLQAGDELVASKSLFGTTLVLFEKYLKKFGVIVHLVAQNDQSAWKKAVNQRTKLLFIETPSNPLNEIADIAFLSDLAHSVSAKLVVDNCFCTPVLQQPLLLGADLVIHSATKYLDGQGRSIGGAIVGSQSLIKEAHQVIRTCGPSMSPFNAWIALKGLETLPLRMIKHSENAQALAEWLECQPSIKKVFYAGLTSHPQYALAQKQQVNGSGILSFEVEGGRSAAWSIVNNVNMISITANLGDTKSTITHPATTTHGRLSAEDKQAAGITEGLLRISVGLEHIEDMKRDLTIAFQQAFKG